MTLAETGPRVGFISALSQNFCSSCNRVRLTCKGEPYTCPGQEGTSDLRPVLRAGVAGAMTRGMNHTGG